MRDDHSHHPLCVTALYAWPCVLMLLVPLYGMTIDRQHLRLLVCLLGITIFDFMRLYSGYPMHFHMPIEAIIGFPKL